MKKQTRRPQNNGCDTASLGSVSPEQLAAHLHRWSNEEMGFQTHQGQPAPTIKDLEWICRGNMMDIWKYVLTNVHSRQTVQKIKGNLAIHGKGDYCQHREELVRELRELEAEVNISVRDVKVLQGDIQRMEKDIMNTEREYQQYCDGVRQMKHQTTLLSAYSGQCKGSVEKYDAYSAEMKETTDKYDKQRSKSYTDTLYFTKQTSEDVEDNGAALETACGRSVREACEAIASFHQQLVRGQFTDKATLHKKRQHLWTKVEDILRDYKAGKVVLSLADNAGQSAYSLREMTSRIDIYRDIEQLKFKYERGSLQDVSTQPSPSLTVRKLLEDAQNEHIMHFVEQEKFLQQSQNARGNLGLLQEQVHELLMKIYQGQAGCLEMAKAAFESEIDLASERVLVEHLEYVVEELELKATKSEAERASLQQKYSKIKNFNKVVEANQNLIQVLLKQNNDAKGKLEQRQHELMKYIESTLCSHEAGVVSMVSKLHDHVKLEAQKFLSLALPNLMLTNLDDSNTIAVPSLSIRRFDNNLFSQGDDAMQHTLTALKFPVFKAPESLLPRVIDLKIEMDDLVL
ncbi:HAUS augmin-like complex subunit 5 [Ptychodera flava]|uniref:HAUS augmin-like complex subunit 5 n=1 Tax=Ptychodera flava TaxID=63121 RepID=UPI003969CE4C